MTQPSYNLNYASEFSKEDIKTFKSILIDAGEVLSQTFDGLIEKNPILMFIPNPKNIDAIGALKTPNLGYKKSVFKESKTNLNPNDFIFELGWIVSLKTNRGNGQLLIQILGEYVPKSYSTVREDNKVMIRLLTRNGYKQTGFAYKSKRGNYKNLLFVKEK